MDENNSNKYSGGLCGTAIISAYESRTRKRQIICVILSFVLGFLLATAVFAATRYYNASGLYRKIGTVKYVIDNEYLYDYEDEALADYAAYGMTASLDDPYTIYYPAKEFTMFTDDGNGEFVGIGITVVADFEQNVILIETVNEGSPAQVAGVKAGDILKKVNDEEYTALEFSKAVAAVRGMSEEGSAEGKEVALTIERNGEDFQIVVVRQKLHIDSVESRMQEEDIGYLRISSFNRSEGDYPDTFEEFKNHLKQLQENGMKKLIIDVRDNGGGDLQEVSNILDMLIPEGVLMYTEDNKGRKDYIYSDADELNVPMTILVNGNSASASELLTGGLKDYAKATVIGTKTYGKGVMQRVYPFSDGSGMVVTVAKYFTPGGTCVQDTGIIPDIEVQMDNDSILSALTYEEDSQLQKAVEVLKQK